MTSFTTSDIERYTNTFVNLHTFFQHYGWSSSWESGQTIRCWCDTWADVYTDLRNDSTTGPHRSSFLLDAEIPSLEDMLVTLSLFTHFLLPLAVPLNTHLNVPVTHASHHGIQTILGVIAKKKNNTALIIWDHGILWRERLRAFSNFRGFPLFARNVLVGLNRMVVQINFYNADVVSVWGGGWCGWWGWCGWCGWWGVTYGQCCCANTVCRNVAVSISGTRCFTCSQSYEYTERASSRLGC